MCHLLPVVEGNVSQGTSDSVAFWPTMRGLQPRSLSSIASPEATIGTKRKKGPRGGRRQVENRRRQLAGKAMNWKNKATSLAEKAGRAIIQKAISRTRIATTSGNEWWGYCVAEILCCNRHLPMNESIIYRYDYLSNFCQPQVSALPHRPPGPRTSSSRHLISP